MITYDPFIDKIIFEGYHPVYGTRVNIIFNEQDQHYKRLLMWNELMGCYMHSTDAGLTWNKMNLNPPHKISGNAIESTDLIIKWWNDL